MFTAQRLSNPIKNSSTLLRSLHKEVEALQLFVTLSKTYCCWVEWKHSIGGSLIKQFE